MAVSGRQHLEAEAELVVDSEAGYEVAAEAIEATSLRDSIAEERGINFQGLTPKNTIMLNKFHFYDFIYGMTPIS